MPWKNGGGTTREIATYPHGAGLDDFHWRLSMAEVAEPGAFSLFADVDRVIAILEGTLALAVDGARAQRLDPVSAPYGFAGDSPAHGQPLGGAVLDLNLMVRRGAARATMRRIAEGPVAASAGTTILFALQDCLLGVGAGTVSMAPYDSCWIKAVGDAALSINRPALLICVDT